MLSHSNVADLAETPRNPLGIMIIDFNERIPRIGRSRLHFYLLTSTFVEFKTKTCYACKQMAKVGRLMADKHHNKYVTSHDVLMKCHGSQEHAVSI